MAEGELEGPVAEQDRDSIQDGVAATTAQALHVVCQ
jgi:hypothetical protein